MPVIKNRSAAPLNIPLIDGSMIKLRVKSVITIDKKNLDNLEENYKDLFKQLLISRDSVPGRKKVSSKKEKKVKVKTDEIDVPIDDPIKSE